MALPECDKNCGSVFHMTGGRHKTNCVLNPFDEAAGWLDLVKQQLWQQGFVEQEYLDFLNAKLAPLVGSEKEESGLDCCCGDTDHSWRICPIHGQG